MLVNIRVMDSASSREGFRVSADIYAIILNNISIIYVNSYIKII